MSENKHLDSDATLLIRLKDFCFGNGQTGVKDRLLSVENTINSEEECAVGRVIKKHMDYHEKSKLYLWGIMVPVWVILVTLFLQVIGVI